MTLVEVYRETGLGPARVNRFENGLRRLLDYHMLAALARCYGCTIEDLLEPGLDPDAT